jgi:2-polyprenyl-3-methyl-5-hydroxy-6-metoxy-1,4-benzoquinol methylase
MQITNKQLEQEATFANEHYAAYANDLAINPRMLQKYEHPRDMWDWRQFGASLLGPVKGQRLLDLGCGMGEESMYFAKLGAQVTAIDISQVGVEIALKRALHNGLADRVQAFTMRADQVEFPDESFDVIHGFGIIHHIGLEAGLKEVKRLLKPGGRGLFFEHMGNSKAIEKMRMDTDYTDYEKPLVWDEVAAYRTQFSRFVLQPFHVMIRLRSISPVFNLNLFRRIDRVLLQGLPLLRHFAGGLVMYVEK